MGLLDFLKSPQKTAANRQDEKQAPASVQTAAGVAEKTAGKFGAAANTVAQKSSAASAQPSSAASAKTASAPAQATPAPVKTQQTSAAPATTQAQRTAAAPAQAQKTASSPTAAQAQKAASPPTAAQGQNTVPAAAPKATVTPAAASITKPTIPAITPTGELQVVIGTTPIKFTTGKPYVEGENVMVPIRELADHLGAKTQWDDASKTATLSKDDDRVEITVGSATAKVNGKTVSTGTKTVVRDDRIYLPIKFLAESLDARYSYDSAKKIAVIS